MDILEAIEKRKSRRSYLSTPIAKDKIEKIESLISKYNEEGGISIQLIEDGSHVFNGLRKSYGMFSGVKSILALIGKAEDPHLGEKLGYYGELLVLEATKLDLGTCWVGGTFDKKTPIGKLANDEILVCVIPIGNVEETQTIKEKLIYKASHRKTKSVEEFYTSIGNVPQWFLEGIKAVQKAPSAMNTQKVKFNYNEGNITAGIENTYVFDLVDLGIAKAHFAIAADGDFEFGNPGKFLKNTK
ncbi:nitroreductase family protein [Clostridium folliculivorans]|uniref:Nitroreductase n=1 Tax=Clostridium folliculivorans TaxID=2886038 RepID=A0A9W5Y0Z6_9CLOT|nr:nitroreductase family protein [Clostridium folliculivorans]GKU24608.1 nitroreductase [Clostridium folliculivorans]GKU30706.1 nitroreductase [Clostridium folliculivorans]